MCSLFLTSTYASAVHITLSDRDWVSQDILRQLLAELLKKQGHTVSYIEYNDATTELEGAILQKVDILPEYWESTEAKGVKNAQALDQITLLSTHSVNAREGWFVPFYMISKCPGLPDWQALKACSHIFKDANSESKTGVFYGPPKNWSHHDDKMIDALGLDFKMIHPEHEQENYDRFIKAKAKEEPIVIYAYTPHWFPLMHPGFFINFPNFTASCLNNKLWGINPEKTYDCDRTTSNLMVIGSTNLYKKSAEAYYLAKEFSLTEAEIMRLILAVDIEKKSIDEVIKTWLEQNEVKWRSWLINAKQRADLSR